MNKLVSGAKKDPDYFEASRRREEKRKRKWKLVHDAAQRLLPNGIRKASDIKKAIEDEHQEKIDLGYIR